MAKAPPTFDLRHSDFISETSAMTPAEVGAYIRLLCYQWANGKIPADQERVARITHLSVSDDQELIREKFEVSGRWMINKDLALLRDKACLVYQNRKKGAEIARSRKLDNQASTKVDIKVDQALVTKNGALINKSINTSSSKRSDARRELDRLPDGIRATVENWLAYKAERREAYKPTALKAFVSRILSEINSTSLQDVKARFERSMAANYKGWEFPLKATEQVQTNEVSRLEESRRQLAAIKSRREAEELRQYGRLVSGYDHDGSPIFRKVPE